jgi:hypothetical protein
MKTYITVLLFATGLQNLITQDSIQTYILINEVPTLVTLAKDGHYTEIAQAPQYMREYEYSRDTKYRQAIAVEKAKFRTNTQSLSSKVEKKGLSYYLSKNVETEPIGFIKESSVRYRLDQAIGQATR